ncbi:MAG: DUF2784 domain-containing protein [Gemmatimonadaceae bacterium]
MTYRILADLVLVLHLAFVIFVVAGAGLVIHRPRVAWLHLPAVVWGVLIEYAGWICPLTPLENSLRMRGGEAGYSGGFIEHYVLATLYPTGLTRTTQVALGTAVLILNLVLYGSLLMTMRKRLLP